uniref:Uncharacterized protein n=1 Tax=Peronospora matthiolae TaxID=2874970 RepID=A0AAV1U607_9STRA
MVQGIAVRHQHHHASSRHSGLGLDEDSSDESLGPKISDMIPPRFPEPFNLDLAVLPRVTRRQEAPP